MSPGGRGWRPTGDTSGPYRRPDPFDRYAPYDEDRSDYDDGYGGDPYGDPPSGQRLTAPIGRPPPRRRATPEPAHLAPPGSLVGPQPLISPGSLPQASS